MPPVFHALSGAVEKAMRITDQAFKQTIIVAVRFVSIDHTTLNISDRSIAPMMGVEPSALGPAAVK